MTSTNEVPVHGHDPHERRLRQLEALVEVAALVNSSLDPREVRVRTLEAAKSLVCAERASLLLVDKPRWGKGKGMRFEVALGDEAGTLRKVHLEEGQGIAGWCAKEQKACIVHDVETDERYYPGLDLKSGFKTRDMVCVPVVRRGELIGVLQAMNKQVGRFDSEDQLLLTTFANQVAIAVDNANLYRRVGRSLAEAWVLALIGALILIVEAVRVLR